MPLQKSPPISRATTNTEVAVEQETRKQRRKTIQTIGDLVPHYATAQGLARKPSRSDKDDLVWYHDERASLNNSKTSRRKSLPRQMVASQRGHVANPPRIPAAPTAAPDLERSYTLSIHPKPRNRNNPKRRSMPSSFEPQGRSLSPVAEAELSRQQVQRTGLPSSNSSRTALRRKQSVGGLGTKEQKGGGWNARRQRDLIKRERDFVEGNAQRERERLGLKPEPAAKDESLSGLSAPKTSVSRYYVHPFPSNQAAIVDANQRDNRARDDSHAHEGKTSSRSLWGTETSEMNVTRRFHRSLSATFEPSSLSYNEVFNHAVACSMVSSPYNSNHSAAPTERHLSDPRSSSSLHTSLDSAPSSSTKSNGSGVSSATKRSERTSLSHAQRPNHPLRQNPVLGNRESFPVLAETSANSSVVSHSPSPPELIMGSTRSCRPSVSSRPSGSPSTCPLPQGLLRRPSPLRPNTVGTGLREVLDTDDVLYRENPDKRGLSTRRPSRQEMDEARKQAAKDKVRERVRRANELEEAREHELGQEEKRKTKGAKGFLCGLFAM